MVNDLQVHCRADGCDDEVHGEHDSDCGWSEARRSHDDSDEACALDPGDYNDVGRSKPAKKIRTAQSDKETANMIFDIFHDFTADIFIYD